MFAVCNASETVQKRARRVSFRCSAGVPPAELVERIKLCGRDVRATTRFRTVSSVSLAELELESLFWPARRQRYKEFLDSLRRYNHA